VSFAGAQEDDGDDDGDGQSARQYRVTVANLTPGQPFTPPLVALHRPSVELFSVGEPASEPIQALAENGNLEPLVELAGSTNSVRAAAVGDEPLVPEEDPGDTDFPYYTELELSADASATHLSFVSMLVATNDGIVGLDTVELPDELNASDTHYANGYDVGTEENTESFEDLVPEASLLITGEESDGTSESNPDLAEDGVIRPHPGIEGGGDLDPAVYDWREPTALVQVERIETDEGTATATVAVAEAEAEATETCSGCSRPTSGDNEVPAVDTDASGTARVAVSEDGDQISYRFQVQNLSNPVAAHIHCGGPDENGPVGITLYNDGVFTPGSRRNPTRATSVTGRPSTTLWLRCATATRTSTSTPSRTRREIRGSSSESVTSALCPVPLLRCPTLVGPPEVERSVRTYGSPALGDVPHLSSRRLRAVERLHPLPDAQVADRKHVLATQREHEEHVRCPRADAGDGREFVVDRVVGEVGEERPVVAPFPVRRGNVLHVVRLRRGEADVLEGEGSAAAITAGVTSKRSNSRSSMASADAMDTC